MKNKFAFTPEQMNGEVEDAYSNIVKECNHLIKITNCPNEQIIALLSVIASNFTSADEKR